MDVHVYGDCSGGYSYPKIDAERCLAVVNADYKFILAFENSLCADYVTEKLWKVLQRKLNVIPVVMGFLKYAELLPPHSFVDITDFSSHETLAEHLKSMAADDALYNEYFRWRTPHDCSGNGPSMGCPVCDYLRRHRHEQVAVDVEEFWAVEKNGVTPEEFRSGGRRTPQCTLLILLLLLLL